MQHRFALLLAPLVLCACEQAKPPEPAARAELPAHAAPAPRTEPAVQIEYHAFGVLDQTPDGRVDFRPTKTVPLRPNQGFGWIIGVTTTKPTVKWREEFILPAPPETWGPVEGKHEISADRKVSILEREVTPERGFISNAWTIGPGDPKGRHVIKVTVADAAPVVFEFDLEQRRAPGGARIGFIKMPEIISNVCFGGSKRNRLFMTGSQSLYAVFVETRGGTLT